MADKSLSFSIAALDNASKSFVKLGQTVDRLHRKIEELDRAKADPEIDVDTRKADAKVGAFARSLQERIQRAVRSLPEIKLGADASQVDRRIQEIRARLAQLSGKTIGIDADAGEAQREITALSAELNRLSRRSPNVQVTADTARAAAALAGVSLAARRLDGEDITLGVNVRDVSRAISLLGLLTAAVAVASTAVGPAIAVIGSLPAVAGAGAQGIGALVAGFSGIGDAVKALSQAETKAAADTAVSAASRTNSAQAIAGAQRQVERAVISADRAAIQGARQVEDARRSLTDAYEQGARQIAQAERQVAQAQKQVTDAQLDLNRARLAAIEANEDLRLSLRGVAIDEREALLDLKDAQVKLAEGMSSGVEGDALERLRIAVDRAQLGLDTTRERFGDLREESAEYARTGVEGSERVRAAQERVADAAQGVRDAEAALAQTRADSSRQVADAQRQVWRAVQQASWAQQDAAASVGDAQRALSNAYVDAGNMGATSLNKVKETMEGLSPEAQRFARFLVSEVIPGMEGIRDAVQATLLPRMETSMRNLGKLGPIVSAGLADTGQVIGDLAVKGSEMMSSGPWRRDFATIMAGHNRVLGDFGAAGLGVIDSLRGVTVAALPMVERFSEFTERAAAAFATFIEGKRATGELDEFFRRMGDTLAKLGRICGQIITGLYDLSEAMGPLGMVVLQAVANLVELIGNLAAAHPQMVQLAAAALLAVGAFGKIGNLLNGLGKAWPAIIAGWKSLGGAVSAIAPAAVAVRLAGVSTALSNAAIGAGTFTEKLTGSAAAGERVMVASGKMSGALVKVGSALPVIGAALIGLTLAYDGLVTSTDEATAQLLKGGDAANQVFGNLRAQTGTVEAVRAVMGDWAADLVSNWIPTARSVADEYLAMVAAMTPLEQAQLRVSQATRAHGDAVKNFGPNSMTAVSASLTLATETEKLKTQQQAAADATQSHTDALKAQSDQMLASVNADLGAQQSKLAVEAAQRSLTDAVRQHGVGSLEAKQAEVAYQQSLAASVEAAGRAALAANASKDATEANRLALQAQNDEIWRLVLAAGSNAPPALLAMANGMSDAELRARGATVRVNELGQRIVELPGGPGRPPVVVTIDANTNPARAAMDAFIRSAGGRTLILKAQVETGNILAAAAPRRAAGSVDYIRPMASGGVRGMAAGVANIVPPNTPTLIGDRRTSNESYIPHTNSTRSHKILDVTAAAMGRTILPMAAGGALLTTGRRTGTPTAVGGDLFGPLTDSASELTRIGLSPLAEELTKTTVPALLLVQRHAQRDTPNTLRSLTQTTAQSATSMGGSWAGLGQRVQTTTDSMRRSITAWQGQNAASWANIAARSGAAVGQITGPQFGGLRAGMDQVRGASTRMSDWVGQAYGRMRGLTADPIRWSLAGPINRGLVPAWNSIDRFFALNRPMGPVPIGFHTGGTVPGAGVGDKVPAMLEPGEEVIPRQVANPHRRFLQALTAGQAEAVQAAGGKWARYALGGTVTQGQAWARAQHGKPYIWGGVGPRGYDCSGFQSALTNVLLGRPPHRRLFSTASFAGGPVAGFTPGLTSAYGIGVFQGNPGHTAGTLAGLNVEAGGSPSMTKAGPGAAGARHSQFRQHLSLPQVGGRFIGGTGGGFDTEGYLRKEFAATRRMIAEIRPRFGPGNPPTAMTRFGDDSVSGAERSVTAFDRGGKWASGRLGINLSGRAEEVLAPAEREAFHRLVSVLTTRRGGAAPIILPAQATAGATNGAAGGSPNWDAISRAIGTEVRNAMTQFRGEVRIVDDGRNGIARIVRRQERNLGRQG